MNKNTAIRIAIDAMTRERVKYSPGHNAYLKDKSFLFAVNDHKKYKRIMEAIEVLDAIRD